MPALAVGQDDEPPSDQPGLRRDCVVNYQGSLLSCRRDASAGPSPHGGRVPPRRGVNGRPVVAGRAESRNSCQVASSPRAVVRRRRRRGAGVERPAAPARWPGPRRGRAARPIGSQVRFEGLHGASLVCPAPGAGRRADLRVRATSPGVPPAARRRRRHTIAAAVSTSTAAGPVASAVADTATVLGSSAVAL